MAAPDGAAVMAPAPGAEAANADAINMLHSAGPTAPVVWLVYGPYMS